MLGILFTCFVQYTCFDCLFDDRHAIYEYRWAWPLPAHAYKKPRLSTRSAAATVLNSPTICKKYLIKMLRAPATVSFFGLSLILLLLGKFVFDWSGKRIFESLHSSCTGSESLPIQKRSDFSKQPARCRDPRPRSSQTSPCSDDETERRYFLHESNPRGCKPFGICPDDAAKYDNQSDYNYFQSFEDCQRECMQRKWSNFVPNFSCVRGSVCLALITITSISCRHSVSRANSQR